MSGDLTEVAAEGRARRAWRWLSQIQADRSLPMSALATALLVTRGMGAGADTVDVAELRNILAERSSSLDLDLQALIRGRHLTWRDVGEGRARATMQFRQGGRRRRG